MITTAIKEIVLVMEKIINKIKVIRLRKGYSHEYMAF